MNFVDDQEVEQDVEDGAILDYAVDETLEWLVVMITLLAVPR